jgi:ABC-type transporter Mla MlaB component
MLQMLPSIEDGRVVLRLDGELDGEGAAAVARLIGQSMGDFAIDFTDVRRVEDTGFVVLAQAIRRCPYRLVVRGLKESDALPQPASSNR